VFNSFKYTAHDGAFVGLSLNVFDQLAAEDGTAVLAEVFVLLALLSHGHSIDKTRLLYKVFDEILGNGDKSLDKPEMVVLVTVRCQYTVHALRASTPALLLRECCSLCADAGCWYCLQTLFSSLRKVGCLEDEPSLKDIQHGVEDMYVGSCHLRCTRGAPRSQSACISHGIDPPSVIDPHSGLPSRRWTPKATG
jgi:hypothetical protein